MRTRKKGIYTHGIQACNYIAYANFEMGILVAACLDLVREIFFYIKCVCVTA